MFGGGAAFHAAAAAAALGQQHHHQAAEYGELGGGVGAAGFYESEMGGSSEPEPNGTSDRPRGGGGSGSKRTRAAEKRRRSRISEKMKALQSLIPSSNKTDKESMLDEAIEYLKQLQLQVQVIFRASTWIRTWSLLSHTDHRAHMAIGCNRWETVAWDTYNRYGWRSSNRLGNTCMDMKLRRRRRRYRHGAAAATMTTTSTSTWGAAAMTTTTSSRCCGGDDDDIDMGLRRRR